MNKYINFSKLLYEFYNEEDVLIDAPMSEHIYFKVGGPADILVTPNTKEQVIKTISLCREHNVPYFLLGNGSNLLVKDGGVEGIVIKFCKLNKKLFKTGETAIKREQFTKFIEDHVLSMFTGSELAGDEESTPRDATVALGAGGTIGAVAANVLGGALLDASGVPLLLTVCTIGSAVGAAIVWCAVQTKKHAAC